MKTRTFAAGTALAAALCLGTVVPPATAAGSAKLPAGCEAGMTLSRGGGSVDWLSVWSRGAATETVEKFRSPVKALVSVDGPTASGRLVVYTNGSGYYQSYREDGYGPAVRVNGPWASTRFVFSPNWEGGDFDHSDIYGITSGGVLVRYPKISKGVNILVGAPVTIARGYKAITAITHVWWDGNGRQYYWATDSAGRLLEIGLTPGNRPKPAVKVLASSGFRGVTALGLGGCGDPDSNDNRIVLLTRTAKGEIVGYVDPVYDDHRFTGAKRYDVGEAGTQRWRAVL